MNLKKKSELSKEEILKRVDEYDILRMYYPANRKLMLNKPTLSPFRDEKEASFIVGTKYGCITYKDMGDSNFRGDIWHFVKQITGLSSFWEVLQDIDSKFQLGLSSGQPVKGRPATITWEKKVIEEFKKVPLIQASVTKVNKQGAEYLKEYGLTLKDMNLFSDTKVAYAKELYINKIRQSVSPFCLIYNLKNERGNWIKSYKPAGRKDNKWRSNIPFTEMHGIEDTIGCETVIVTKSIKDAAVITKYTGLCTTVIQAEDISAISEKSKDILSSIPNLYIATDNDKKGKQVSWELTALFKCKHVNPPDWLIDKKGTDFSDMAKICGPNTVIEHFKTKNII